MSRRLFQAAALYDGLRGALLFFAPSWSYRQLNIAEPGHPAYVQFTGAVLLIFAGMFLKIAHEPSQYRHLMPYGIQLKAAYCVLAAWYGMNNGIPQLWMGLAVADFVLMVLFTREYLSHA
jgi:hypothetical protein